jgi:hypothetical protein
MKTILSLAAASLALVAIAEPSPIIGVTQISTTNKNTLVAVPFTSLTNSTVALSVKDLVCTNGLDLGTWIYVHTGSAYAAWKLEATGWTAAVSQTSGGQIIDASAADANQTVNYGTSFWIVLPEAPAAGTPKTFCIYGNATVLPSSPAITAGVNFVANTTQADATLTVGGMVAGDEIVMPQDGGNLRYQYGISKKTKEGKWLNNGAIADSIQVKCGQGFWYITTNTAQTVTFTFN